jgi:8-oxo-dGTP diphosphatase
MINAPVLATLVYCVREDHVLLLRRVRPPFEGSWVGPGGKIEPTESPCECAIRELREETSLVAKSIELRGVVREVSSRLDWQWLLFLYCVTSWDGSVAEHCREGELRWWRIDQLAHIQLPEADRIFMPAILDRGRSLFEARFRYDDELRLVETSTFGGA